MTVGYVAKNQVPMIITFDEFDAEFVINSLAHALERSYATIDFFSFKDDDEDIWG